MISPPSDLVDLATYSARIGNDPLLIQSAGGNTSVKDGDIMWIKASGTLLAEALHKDIFVPVDHPAMRAAMDDPSIDADKPAQFLVGDADLRPSIETSLHALFPHRVVIHVHCVNTLAHAVRSDVQELLDQKLAAFDWCLVPYAKPGANLARAVLDALSPTTEVAVLRNHGLLVAAGTVDEAEALVGRVVDALTVPADGSFVPDVDALAHLATADWVQPENKLVHQLAEPHRAKQARKGSMYPDHVIFCGPGAHVVEGAILPEPDGAPPFVILPGIGVLVQPGWSTGAQALTKCLADVLMRVPEGAPLNYLSAEENAELLDWDAEKYRKKLDV